MPNNYANLREATRQHGNEAELVKRTSTLDEYVAWCVERRRTLAEALADPEEPSEESPE